MVLDLHAEFDAFDTLVLLAMTMIFYKGTGYRGTGENRAVDVLNVTTNAIM